MKQRTSAQMYAFVEQYLSSSQSQRAFCEMKGEPLHVLNYWLKKYRQRNVSVNSESSFSELSIEQSADTQIMIKHPNGLEIYIPI